MSESGGALGHKTAETRKSSRTEALFRCVRCKRNLPRDQVVGYTHLLDWTYICRNSVECDNVRKVGSWR